MELFHGNTHALGLEQHIIRHLSLIDRTKLGQLAIIQLGTAPSSEKYVALKLALCKKLGIPAISHKLPESLPRAELFSEVSKICNASDVKSVLIQLPLPLHIDKELLNLIPLEKDIDMLSALAQQRFYSGDFTLLSPVIRSVEYFLNFYKMNASGLSVDVVGKGFLVGNPLAYYFAHLGALVRSYDEKDDIAKMVFKADLVVTATGHPKILQGNNFYQGTSVIDFGSAVQNGKVVGDFDSGSECGHLKFLASSPGGLGPLVVRYLLINHLGA